MHEHENINGRDDIAIKWKREFLSSSSSSKATWQAYLDKYLKLVLVEMVGWYPGLKKRKLD